MKKIKIKFVDFGTQYAFQILEQEGFPHAKHGGNVRIKCCPDYNRPLDILYLRGYEQQSDMDVIIKPYRVNENFQHIINHFFDMLKKCIIDMDTHNPISGDMVDVKIKDTTFISRKLLAILPEEYKNRYVIDIGGGYVATTDCVFPKYKTVEQKIETSEKGDVVIITLTQQD